DHQKQRQRQIGEDAGDGIPAPLDGKARKVLGLVAHGRHGIGATPSSAAAGAASSSSSSSGGGAGAAAAASARAVAAAAAAASVAAIEEAGAGRGPPPPSTSRPGSLPKRHPVRPVQASPSPLPVQQRQHHFPGHVGSAPVKAPLPAAAAVPVAVVRESGGGGGDAAWSATVARVSTALSAEDGGGGGAGAVPPTPVSPSGSDSQGPSEGLSGGAAAGGGRRGGRGGGGADGGGGPTPSSGNSHLPPRDGQLSAADVRAAQVEAEKIAALRHYVSEAKLETEAKLSGGGGGFGGGEGASPTEMLRSEPPVLPSGKPLREGSKAWKVLGPDGLGRGGGGGGRSRSPSFGASSGILPSDPLAAARFAEFQTVSDCCGHPAPASPSGPALGSRLATDDGGGGGRGRGRETPAELVSRVRRHRSQRGE
ncbi:unnamed protein product, partial [Hapterophycus canaliculatus]